MMLCDLHSLTAQATVKPINTLSPGFRATPTPTVDAFAAPPVSSQHGHAAHLICFELPLARERVDQLRSFPSTAH